MNSPEFLMYVLFLMGGYGLPDLWCACGSPFTKMTDMTKTMERDEDNSDSYKQGVECWISGNRGNHGTTKATGIRRANHGFPKRRNLLGGQFGPEKDI